MTSSSAHVKQHLHSVTEFNRKYISSVKCQPISKSIHEMNGIFESVAHNRSQPIVTLTTVHNKPDCLKLFRIVENRIELYRILTPILRPNDCLMMS